MTDSSKRVVVGDCKSTRFVFLKALSFRIVNALCVNTYFNPDEYWQSLEVAHNIAFGYGHLTWEWKERIRGFSHPLVFAAVYYLLRITGLDYPMAVVLAPRVVQAVLAAVADTFLYRIVDRYDKHLADFTMYCNAFCWFMFYCDVRTFSNTMEAQLCIIALYYWLVPRETHLPSDDNKSKDPKDCETTEYKDDIKGRILASTLSGIAFVMRPTAAIFLCPVVLLHLYWTFKALKREQITFLYVLRVLFLQMAFPVILVIAAATLIDSILYGGEFTFVPFNFLYHNVLHSVADFYGTHSWHWYFTQGFPAMLGPFVVLFIIGVLSPQCLPRVLLFLLVWPIAVFSVLKHKEFRFVLTSLYLAMPFCAAGLETIRFKVDNPTLFQRVRRFFRRAFIALLFVSQLLIGYVFCFVYQLGPVAVMHSLTEMATMSEEELKQHNLIPVESVAFLCECHSTPYYAYVHTHPGLTNPPFEMSFLDCTPDFAHNLSTEFVEDRIFQRNPSKFAFDRYVNSIRGHKRQHLPSHIVSFSKYDEALESFYTLFGYRECAVFPHDLETNVTLRYLLPEPEAPNPHSPLIDREMFANEDDDDLLFDPFVQGIVEGIVHPVKNEH